MAESEYRYHPSMDGLVQTLAQFKEDAKCLCEAFDVSEESLVANKQKATSALDDFISRYRIANGESKSEEIRIPHSKEREYEKLKECSNRAERAYRLVSQNFLVSLVSVYDLFYAEIVRIVYKLNPNILKADETPFLYRTLLEHGSVGAVASSIVEKQVDSLIRDSHMAQIAWLEKTLKVTTLRDFPEWSMFIELTERRNLFVHSNGIVSSQYMNICKTFNAIDEGVSIGSMLSIDKEYFIKAYMTLYKMAIGLTAIIANICCRAIYKGYSEELDKMVIRHVYDAITEHDYDLAIDISNFILSPQFKHKNQDKSFIILNLAQAYKWKGEEKKCAAILDEEDTSAWKRDLLIPKLVLEEKYADVYDMMRSVGLTGKILNKDLYRQWPIFKKLREQEEFKVVFKDIFEEELYQETDVVVESTIEETGELTSESTED
jgi:hypothetical protein